MNDLCFLIIFLRIVFIALPKVFPKYWTPVYSSSSTASSDLLSSRFNSTCLPRCSAKYDWNGTDIQSIARPSSKPSKYIVISVINRRAHQSFGRNWSLAFSERPSPTTRLKENTS